LDYNKGMAALVYVVTVPRDTIAQAEDAIAALWLVLEENQMPTPKLRVKRELGIVHIDIEFQSQRDADLMREAISRLAPVGSERT
jgi:hypothetical protein